MPSLRAVSSDRLISSLDALAALDAEDPPILANIMVRTDNHPVGSVLLQQGQSITGPRLLVSGWACQTRALSNGQRQIFAIVLPGDFIGLCWLPNPVALSSTVALTAVMTSDASVLQSSIRGDHFVRSGLREALTLKSRHDEMRLMDHVVRLGRQSALARMASFVLELHLRLRQVGLADERVMPFPLTQDTLSGVLGLSLVHVNRTLQILRKDGLVHICSGSLVLLDRSGLCAVSDFGAMLRPLDGVL